MTTKTLRTSRPSQPRLKPLNLALALAITQIGVAGTANAQTALLPRSSLPSGATVVQGANAPTINQQTMTIDQTAPRAIVNWSSFNIGSGHTVRFNQQGQKDWAVLNRVVGNERSVLQGVLQADGQVFLLNNNGILIGRGAQINVNTFLASTLTLSDKVFKDGFLSLGGSVPTFVAGTGEFAPKGNIRIEPGAIVTASDSGRIFFFASGVVYDQNGQALLDTDGKPIGLVENAGTLKTSAGQIILAAGDRVFLRTADTVVSPTNKENNLAGLVVTVDAGGQVANALMGYVQSRLGNISMVGMVVNQSGRVSATTSVERNGSIWLMAQDTTAIDGSRAASVVATRGGKLSLGPESLTEVLPDFATSSRTSIDASPFNASQMRLEGERIHFQGREGVGAKLYAPGGSVELRARTDPTVNILNTAGNFPTDSSAIVLDKNTTIDVSGLRAGFDQSGQLINSNGVAVPIERNSVRIELLGEQLADAPVLRSSGIARDAIYVDVRRGTTLINQDSYRNAVAAETRRDILERMTTGGTVMFNALGTTLLQNGSTVRITGGAIEYSSGIVRTSRLFDGSSYYAIATAPNNRNYRSVSDVLTRTEAGYLEGQRAGSVLFGTRNLLLHGQVIGGAVTGTYQRAAAPWGGLLQNGVFDGNDKFTFANRLDLGLVHGLNLQNNTQNDLPQYLPTEGEITGLLNSQFTTNLGPLDQSVNLLNLTDSRLSRIDLSTNSTIRVTAGNTFSLAAGSEFNLIAQAGLDVQRSIRIHAGRLLLSGGNANTAIGSGVVLDASGLWLNDRLSSSLLQASKLVAVDGTTLTTRSLVDGGRVTLQGSSVEFGENTRIDVSAGTQINTSGQNNGGNAGSINSADAALPTQIMGFGFGAGAVLTLDSTGSLWSGNQAPADSYKLDSSLLSQYGLGGLDLRFRSVTLAAGTSLRPSLLQYQLANRFYLEDGDALRALARTVVLPSWQTGSMSLRLSGDTVVMQLSSSINMPARGAVTLNSSFQTTFGGKIVSQGGKVSLTNNVNYAFGYRAGEGIELLGGSVIDVSGSVISRADPSPYRLGSVTNGGDVILSTTGSGGSIHFAPTAEINLDGTRATFDVAQRVGRATRYAQQSVFSSAGSLIVNTGMGGIFAGNITASPGGPGAARGRLSFSFPALLGNNFKVVSERPNAPEGYTFFPAGERQYVITAPSETVSTGFSLLGDFDLAINGARPISNPFSDLSRDNFALRLNPFRISSRTITGLGELSFGGGEVLRFEGADRVAASETLRIDTLALRSSADQVISLTAPWIRIGSIAPSGNQPQLSTVVSNNGKISINGSIGIDLFGQSYIQGAESVLLSTAGSIRLEGETQTGRGAGQITVARDIKLQASTIYPVSRSDFTVNALNGTVTVNAQGNDAANPAYSANGSLTVNAQNIEQRGSVLAPFGEIKLNASQNLTLGAGSVISVSGDGLLLPYGQVTNGRDWIVSQNFERGTNEPVTSPPKQVSLSGPSVIVESTRDGLPSAVINVSGGGDLVASEFVSGPSGASNLFNTTGAFAIVPSYRASLAPLASGLSSSVAIGSTIRIGTSSPGLPAGNYVILPAAYAQLTGAFLVRPTSASNLGTALPGAEPLVSNDGIATVIGYRERAGFSLSTQKAEWFELLNATQLRERMELRESTASRFFNDAAGVGNLVQDAGTLRINARRELAMNGTADLTADLSSSASIKGVSGRLEISSDLIQISSDSASNKLANTVQVSAITLEQVGARETILGGRLEGNNLVTDTRSITVDSGVSLSQQNLVLVSQSQMSVGNDVSLSAASTTVSRSITNPTITVTQSGQSTNSSGNLIAVTTDPRLINRPGNTAAADVALNVGDRVQLRGPTVVVDSTGTSNVASTASFSGTENTQIGAQRVLVGTAPTNATGLRFSPSIIDSLNQSTNSYISAYESVTAYGTTSLGNIAARRFILDAPALLAGQANTNLIINGQSIEWSNQRQTSLVAPAAATSESTLLFNATGTDKNTGIVLGVGNKRVGGFSSTQMQVGASSDGSSVQLSGNGTLRTSGDLTITTDKLTANALSEQSLSAVGNLTIGQRFGPAPVTTVDRSDPKAGARVDISASSVTVDSSLSFRSGEVNLLATGAAGTLTVGSNASIDLSGYSLPIVDQQINLAAGRIKLVTEGASSVLNIAAGAVIDVSAPLSSAGSIDILSNGQLSLSRDASIRAGQEKPNARGGSLTIDTQRGANLNDVANLSVQGGFNKALDVRARSGDLSLDSNNTLKAQSVRVAVDNGSLNIAGSIDARAADGGSVELWQRSTTTGTLNLNNGAQIDVRGATGGGDITIGSNNAIRVSGVSEVKAGSSDGRDQGRLTLRTPRTGPSSGTGVALSAANPNSRIAVQGNVNTVIEGVRRDLTFASTVGSSAPQTAINSDVTAFLANQSRILANAPINTANPIKLSAGIELTGAAGVNLVTSANTIDFSTTSGLGALTIRAAENLTINGSISDGITSSNAILNRDSWTYRLTAGADLAAANPNAVRANPNTDVTPPNSRRGDLSIAANKDIRTGTGSIALAAAGNITFNASSTAAAQPASVYTFGRRAEISDGYQPGSGYFSGQNVATTNGGSIQVRANGDITANNMETSPATWLLRQGALDPVTGEYSRVPGWIANIGALGSATGFNMHIGSLGGGGIDLRGRDIQNLYVASVTAGRLRSTTPNADALEVINKAPVSVYANRDVLGGQFTAMGSDLLIQAGSRIAAPVPLTTGAVTNGPLPMHADNAVIAEARSSVRIGVGTNPTLSPNTVAVFSTYGANSLLNVSSFGDVLIQGGFNFRANAQAANIAASLGSPNWLVQSGNSVRFTNVNLAPTTERRISVLAGESIYAAVGSTASSIVASAGKPADISVLNPTSATTTFLNPKFGLGNVKPDNSATLNGVTNLPARFFAGQGDIGTSAIDNPSTATLTLNFNQPIHVNAGRDVRQLALFAQNNLTTEQTTISAGRDVINSVEIGSSGTLVPNFARVEVAGPGSLVVEAGRDIRLGNNASTFTGISTIGNAKLSDLPAGGASIVLIAGLDQSPRYGAMLEYYLKPDGTSAFDQSRYTALAKRLFPEVTETTDAQTIWNRVQTLSQPVREQLARDIFFSELRIAGGPDTSRLIQNYLAPVVGTNTPQRLLESLVNFVSQKSGTPVSSSEAWNQFGTLAPVEQAEFVSLALVPNLLANKIIAPTDPLLRNYARGYQAAAQMFATDGQGNIDLAYNSVRANQGGSVQIMSPGVVCRAADAKSCFGADSSFKPGPEFGNVRVGLSNPPPSLSTTSLGVFGLGGASVSTYAGNDIDINQSRIVTGGGGNLLLWSSGGSIDAGRGSKAAISAPPPVIRFDSSGNVTVDLSNAIQGSGIRAVSFSDKVPSGEVSLFAPKGTIDAGDAGIQGGNVNVGASIILNADNIRLASDPTGSSVTFDSSGNAGTIAPASSGNSGVGNVVPKEAQGGNTERAVRRTRIVIVDFEGFGVDCKEKPDDPSCKPKPN